MVERSGSFLDRLRGSFRSKRAPHSLLNEVDNVTGDVCSQCRGSALISHRAAYYGHVPCLAWVAKEEPEKLDGVDRNGATPLLLAVRQNRLKAVTWILQNRPHQAQQKAMGGETPILVSAALGRLKCLELLHQFDAKIKNALADDADSSGLAAIHLAALKDRPEVLAWLLKVQGKSAVIQPTKSGITAVHIAAASGHLTVLQMLTKKDKKGVFYVDSAGTTPVYFAAQEGRLECLRHLVENCKGDAIARCDDGMTTVHCAAQGGHLHIVQWLVSEQGEHIVLAKTQDGATPVHFAAAMGRVELLEWILTLPRVGALARDTTDLDGGTPAHDAADNNQLQCLNILKSHGVNFSITDNEGFTAVDIAVNSTDRKCQEWGTQMMREASWQNTVYAGEEPAELQAAAASASSIGTDESPALPPRESTGLTDDDRSKSSSREINIDEAVRDAEMQGRLRASTLPTSQRPKVGGSKEDSPYAIPMRLLSKIRSNSVGNRPGSKKSKKTHSKTSTSSDLATDDNDEEETALVNTAALEFDPVSTALEKSPDIPANTSDSTVLLTADDSDGGEDCDKQAAQNADDATASDAPDTGGVAMPTADACSGSKTSDDTNAVPRRKTIQPQVSIVIEEVQEGARNIGGQAQEAAADPAAVAGSEPADTDTAALLSKDEVDARMRPATLPGSSRATSGSSDQLATESPLQRRSTVGSESDNVIQARRRGLFDSPKKSPGERVRKLSPNPLPDASRSPLLQRRRKASRQSEASIDSPLISRGRDMTDGLDSSDDNLEDDVPATKTEVEEVFSKASHAEKMLGWTSDSSSSSSADESD